MLERYVVAWKSMTGGNVHGVKELFEGTLSINKLVLILLAILTIVLRLGVRESLASTSIMAMTKVIIVIFVIVIGFFKIDVSNWYPLVTNGFKVAVTGDMVVFFAYKFYTVVISIEECRNPQRNLPKDAWALFLDHDALNIFTGEWIPNPETPYYTNLSCRASHKHQTCMTCGYIGTPCDPKSYFKGLKEYIEKASCATGCLNMQCTVHNGQAIQIAKEADVVMVVVGLDLSQETDGQALAKLIEFNPSGRLPMTWYPEALSGKKALVSANDGVADWVWSLVIKGRAWDVIEGDMPQLVTKTDEVDLRLGTEAEPQERAEAGIFAASDLSFHDPISEFILELVVLAEILDPRLSCIRVIIPCFAA
ncbi:hypothetical protein NE237_025700 [Protea cynaroides]|uniref:Uncharacterized protein n=1 Tax=Protea cynaroides TaxID=273540 RepID=A0A9Q0H3M3_9MAGN|nr:hypothetical protein NE237_025700 [Protea cynaroides]